MITEAIKNLRPGASWALDNEYIIWEEVLTDNGSSTGKFVAKNLRWFSPDISIPSKEEVETEVAKLEQEFAANEYKLLRQPEYPPITDLADALYWQSQGDDSKMTAYLAAVEAVKQKYPKGV